ncbi:MAG TPA: RNA-binding protein [Gammaproteobacteria bacterium]|nr:RNA-binding protein [Gammaproteobacteria bacterium]
MKSIYVGNLPFSASDEDIRTLFSQYGTVHAVKLVMDRETGRPRGFGFVEMEAGDAATAIERLNGTEFGGRTLRVNEARERAERAPRRSRPAY